jgi:predicted transcriptional regulator
MCGDATYVWGYADVLAAVGSRFRWLGGINIGIIEYMAMTLRLDDQETDALRQQAEHEGRSMQEIARQAVREYVERTSKRALIDRALAEELPRYAEALRRLGE